MLSTLQDDGERYRRYIRAAALVIGYLTCPTYAVAAAVSAPLVALLLGPRWERGGDDLQHPRDRRRRAGDRQRARDGSTSRSAARTGSSCYYVVTRPIIIAGYFFGIWWAGMNGLALVYGLLTVLLLVPGFAFAIRGTFVTAGDIVRPDPPTGAARAPGLRGGVWAAASLLSLPRSCSSSSAVRRGRTDARGARDPRVSTRRAPDPGVRRAR